MTLWAQWVNPEDNWSAVEMTVESPADVDLLIERLRQPTASDAGIIHSERSMTEFDGERFYDHTLGVGIASGYGYLRHHDPDNPSAHSLGEPQSPEYPAFYMHAPAGSGVSLDVLRTALVEFMTTAERPTNVRWQEIGADLPA